MSNEILTTLSFPKIKLKAQSIIVSNPKQSWGQKPFKSYQVTTPTRFNYNTLNMQPNILSKILKETIPRKFNNIHFQLLIHRCSWTLTNGKEPLIKTLYPQF